MHTLENRFSTDLGLKLFWSLSSAEDACGTTCSEATGLLPFPNYSLCVTAAPKTPGDYLLSQERMTPTQRLTKSPT